MSDTPISGAAASTPPRKLEHGGVRFTPEWVSGVERGRPFIRISRQNILGITLTSGHVAARPLTQALLGIVVFGLGCWPLVTLIDGVIHGEVALPKTQALLGTLTILGAWLIAGAVRRGYYLEVETGKRKEKIPFELGVSKQEIDAFLSYVRRENGYVVKDGTMADPPA